MLQRAPEFRVGVTVSSLQPTYAMSGFYELNIVAIYALSTLVCVLLVYATYVDFIR